MVRGVTTMALNMFVALGVNVTVFSAHDKKVNKWKRVRAEGGKKKEENCLEKEVEGTNSEIQ